MESKTPAWRKGARWGAFIGALLYVGFLFYLWGVKVDERDELFTFYMLLPIINFALVGYCIGALIGRFFGKDPIPYWLKFASVIMLAPTLFLFITMFESDLGMGFMAVLFYFIVAPVPLFLAGALIGAIVWKIRTRNRPDLRAEVSKGFVVRFFDYFLKP